MSLLEVKQLAKNYKDFSLQDISFEIPEGYIMGYIGRNGAGKTTTLNSITHLIRPDGGDVRIDGIRFEEDPVAFRKKIGYIGDSGYFPQDFTPSDIRKILKDFYETFDADVYNSFLDRWELPEKMTVKQLSRGMNVKLMFASVLSRQTRLLILDEATNGLDPVVRRDVLKILQDYIADGNKSVLFSTHIMEDLQNIADYIFLIDNGKKILCEAKDDLLERYLLVHCGRHELTPDMEKGLIGLEKNEYGVSALFDTESSGILPSLFVTEKPTIDEIVVHLLSNRRTESWH